MRTVDEYTVRGESQRLKILITAPTYTNAIRAGKTILLKFPEVGTVNVKNRKGELLKVIRKIDL